MMQAMAGWQLREEMWGQSNIVEACFTPRAEASIWPAACDLGVMGLQSMGCARQRSMHSSVSLYRAHFLFLFCGQSDPLPGCHLQGQRVPYWVLPPPHSLCRRLWHRQDSTGAAVRGAASSLQQRQGAPLIVDAWQGPPE